MTTDTKTLDQTARYAAVVAYANKYADAARLVADTAQTVTQAVRDAYADKEWQGISDALGYLSGNFEAHKPAVASLKTILVRIGRERDKGDTRTISFKGGRFELAFSKKARTTVTLASYRRAAMEFRAQQQAFAAQFAGLSGADELERAIACHIADGTPIPEFEFEQRREVIGIVVKGS